VLLAALVGLRQDPVTTPPAEDGGLFPADAPVLVSDRFGPTLELYPVRIVHTVSQEQFAVGVFDPQTGPIEAGSIDLRFYKAANGEAVLTETVAAEIVPNRALGEPDRELAVGMGLAGAFIARPTIDAPGPWIVVALASLPDGTQRAGQADFMVEAGTPIPSPG
jgi:hypothetical protein